MEIKIDKIVLVFIFVLITTLLFTRVPSYFLMDKEGYSSDKVLNHEEIKTPTAFLRKNLGIDIHHIHLGLLGLLVIVPLIYLGFVNFLSISFLAINISMVLDQIFPLLNFGNYFGFQMYFLSFLLHLIFIEAILILNYNKN